MCWFCTYNHTILNKMSIPLGHTRIHSHTVQFSHHTQEVVSQRLPPIPSCHEYMAFPYHLFIIFVFILSLSCLFVSLMFLFKASKDTPCPLPPSQHPPSPRAVRMICKLQTTKSPSLVSSAHLGNSISRGGEAQRHAASPSCPRCPCSSDWSRSDRSATNISLQCIELLLRKDPL